MTEGKRGPTFRAHWLGQRLKDLRHSAKLKLEDAGAFLQRDPSTVSRFETGEYPIRRPELRALLDLYRVSDERVRDDLLALGDEIWRTGWWEDYGGHVAKSFIDHAWLEERSRAIDWFEALVVPGLLQTRAYAEATIRCADSTADERKIEQWVEFRMRRQRVLDTAEPPRMGVILDEAVLRRPVGGAETMREQFKHLLLCGQRPWYEIRVLPFSGGGHPSPDGAFVILELAEPYPVIAYAQTVAGAAYVEPPRVERFTRVYDQLREATYGPDESAELIEAAMEDLQ